MIAVNTPTTFSATGGVTPSVSNFNISYPTFEASDIVVSVLDPSSNVFSPAPVLGVDFSLKFVGVPGQNTEIDLIETGKAYTHLGFLNTNYTLKVNFSVNAFQPAKFRELGRFSPETFEVVLDRLTMFILAIKDVTVSLQAQITAAILSLQTQITAVVASVTALAVRVTTLETEVSGLMPTWQNEAVDFTAQYGKVHVLTGATNVQLPALVDNSKIRIKLNNYTVNILRHGAENIDYVAATLVLPSNYEYIEFNAIGGNWLIS